MCEYELLSAGNADSLSSEVNRRLNNGWSLYGSPVVTTWVNDGAQYWEYAQAVVR
jgi:hypothetical protein